MEWSQDLVIRRLGPKAFLFDIAKTQPVVKASSLMPQRRSTQRREKHRISTMNVQIWNRQRSPREASAVSEESKRWDHIFLSRLPEKELWRSSRKPLAHPCDITRMREYAWATRSRGRATLVSTPGEECGTRRALSPALLPREAGGSPVGGIIFATALTQSPPPSGFE